MKTYEIQATREASWWALSIAELDTVTQSRTLDGAETMARDLIATWLDVEPASFAIRLVVDFAAQPAPATVTTAHDHDREVLELVRELHAPLQRERPRADGTPRLYCGHCMDIHAYDVGAWPCDTAKLVYSIDEMEVR